MRSDASATTVHVIIPGRLDTPTGGFVYDRRMVAGLCATGRCAGVIMLPGAFPSPSPAAVDAAAKLLAALDDGTWLLVDGLALTPLAPLFCAAATRLNLIALIHHPLCDESGLSPAATAALFQRERDALCCVRGVIVTSATTGRRLADFAVPADRIAVVTPGAVDRPQHRRRGGQRKAPAEVLSVGSLIPRKGQDLLLAALASLRRCRWRASLVGAARDASFARHLRLRIRALGLGCRVRICGALPAHRLNRCYQRADLFVLASRHEGFGMVLPEALAHGLPVIATTAGAIPESVPAGSATLVPSDDLPALTRAMRPLLSRPTTRLVAASRAQRFARHARCWSTAVQEFETALNRIMAQ